MYGNKFKNFISQNIAPKNAQRIIVSDNDGQTVGGIMLGKLKQPSIKKLYSFCAISDVHIGYDTSDTDFQRALTFVDNSDCLFTCICGDLTASGNDTQLTQYKSIVDTYATKPVYAVCGNHESIWGNMTTERIQPYTGKPFYYSFAQGNDVFIMLGHYGAYHDGNGGWREAEYFTTDELQFLYNTLESNRNKRCFVFYHIFPLGGSGDACGYYMGSTSSSKWTQTVTTVFEKLMKHYKNVVLFHGHSHLRLHLQSEDDRANYVDDVGYRSIHIPSISVPRDRTDSGTSYIYAESEGYIVDVYDNYIILNGRDFIDNDNDGNIIPIGTYKIDTPLVTVEAGTFVDSTGTITT